MLSERCRGGKEKGHPRLSATDILREESRTEPRPPERVAVMYLAVFARVPRDPYTGQVSLEAWGWLPETHTPVQAWI